MSQCAICEHAKIGAIDVAIVNGRLLSVVATQFRVKKSDLITHVKHAPTQAPAAQQTPMLSPGGIAQYLDYPAQQATETPMSQFKHHLGPLAEAYHRADDLTIRDRMRFLLNEALQADNMGLP